MTRRGFISLAAAASASAQSVADEVGASRDLVYQALEMLSVRSTPAQINRAIGFIKRSLDQYAGFGDAHYYRYLCLRRINQEPGVQARSLEAAQRYGSEALDNKRDPFTLAVPKIYDNLVTVGQKWALVVGISRFQPEIGAPRLGCPAADADVFAKLLTDPEIGRFPKDQVFLLTDQGATTASIKARLNRIATRAKSEDVVVVYVSSHGSSRSDDIRQVSYIYTYDTDVTSKDQMFGTALPMVEVSGIVSTRCLAQRTVLIFDTCHSGETIAQNLSGDDVDRLREGAGRYILSSCQANQKSYEDAEHGFFTASLVDVLRERKGCVRLNDLFRQVQSEVRAKAANMHKDQAPAIFKSENASEIVLGAAAGASGDHC